MVRLPMYVFVLRALRVALCILLVALLVLGDIQAALIDAVFLGLSFAHLLRSDRRPALFDVLFALAALAGAVGFVFGLFDEIVPYDELTHAFTTFSVSLTFYFLFYRGAVPEGRAVALGTSVFTLGVTVGAYWEIFEWFFIGKYTMADTISDLLVDSGGALAAALVTLALRRSGIVSPRASVSGPSFENSPSPGMPVNKVSPALCEYTDAVPWRPTRKGTPL